MSEDNHTPAHGDPFQVLLDHFEENGIKYSSSREKRRAWFTMNSGSALQKCTFGFDRTGDVLQIRIQYPVLAKEKFRPLANEFITRANYGLVIGNFEMDVKDGEIRYHVSHLMEDGRLTDESIRRLFGTAMGTADRYFPALMRVLFAGETPIEAIDLAELHKFDVEEPAKPKTLGSKIKGTSPSSKTPRAKRHRKSRSSKQNAEQSTLDLPSKNPPPAPPAHPQDQSGDEEEGRQAA
jgi:hypothetical protein